MKNKKRVSKSTSLQAVVLCMPGRLLADWAICRNVLDLALRTSLVTTMSLLLASESSSFSSSIGFIVALAVEAPTFLCACTGGDGICSSSEED